MCVSIQVLRVYRVVNSGIAVHLERLGSMSEDAVRFYVAEIASALTFLHEKRIIHRCVVGSSHL